MKTTACNFLEEPQIYKLKIQTRRQEISSLAENNNFKLRLSEKKKNFMY